VPTTLPIFHIFSPTEIALKSAEYIAGQLLEACQNSSAVFLLLSGGSASEMYKQMFAFLPTDLTLQNLTVGLVDERFGSKGHAESNEKKLFDKGVLTHFIQLGAHFLPMLPVTPISDGVNGLTIVAQVNAEYTAAFTASQRVIVLAGVGEDGHTAGLLPTHSAEKFTEIYDKPEYVTYYDVDPLDSTNPFRQRFTITTQALKTADTVIVFANGETKHDALQRVKTGAGEFYQTPALALSLAKNPVVVFTDQNV
jgi:6-phosphogluconolactonase/glucosamine-6-phosphate isomerase/deaminase